MPAFDVRGVLAVLAGPAAFVREASAAAGAGGPGLLVGSFTTKYQSLYPGLTSASITGARLALLKGTSTGNYVFVPTPLTSGPLAQFQSKTVEHNIPLDSGNGDKPICGFCGGKMTLIVDWKLSNGEKRTDNYGAYTVNCSSP